MTRLFILTAITLFLTTTSVLSQNSLQGIWEGGISVPGGQLKVIFKIDRTGSEYSGTLDIPQQGAKGLRLDPISQIDESVSLTFKAGGVTGVFNGHFDSATKITGTYGQGGPTTPFTVERTSTTTQDPAKPANETDLILQNDDIKIGGTLTLPDGDIKAPLLIMSSGSGAQDRDSDIYDFKIFGIIAQHLAKMESQALDTMIEVLINLPATFLKLPCMTWLLMLKRSYHIFRIMLITHFKNSLYLGIVKVV